MLWGFAAPWISDHIGRKPAMIIFTATAVLAPLCLIYVDSPMLLAGLLILTYTGLGRFTLLISTIPAETVPVRSMATAIGMIMGGAIAIIGFVMLKSAQKKLSPAAFRRLLLPGDLTRTGHPENAAACRP